MLTLDGQRAAERSASLYEAGERDTLVQALDRAVRNVGDEIFVDVAGDTLTFREFDRRSTRLANEFVRLGLRKGDRLVTISETHADTLLYWFGAVKMGAIWAPINLAYRQEFLRHQIVDSGAKLVICDASYLDRLLEIAHEIPAVERILCRGGSGTFPACHIPIADLDAHRGQDERPVNVEILPGDLATLTYTSGTTGPSKGCMISHNYMCMQGRQQRRAVALAPGDVTWTPLPLFHSAALTAVLGALIVGGRIALSPRFSLGSFWEDVERSGASRAFLMASIFSLVAHAPDSPAMQRCHGQLKVIQGVPITPEIRRIWENRFGVQYVCFASYGLTEINRLTMVPYGETAPDHSVGRAADEFELAILDTEDRPVPPGETGEICCRPRHPNIMFEGYWNRAEETVRVWRNGWMHTGDLGRLDENGYLYFVDRAKDYLRCRGENVSSFEVEKVFLTHPAVSEAALHATSLEAREDDIKITIVLKDHADAGISAEQICRWSIERLPYFAVPRYFEFRPELPKNPTGRVLKYRLREQGVTPTTWDREAAGIHLRRQRP